MTSKRSSGLILTCSYQVAFRAGLDSSLVGDKPIHFVSGFHVSPSNIQAFIGVIDDWF